MGFDGLRLAAAVLMFGMLAVAVALPIDMELP